MMLIGLIRVLWSTLYYCNSIGNCKIILYSKARKRSHTGLNDSEESRPPDPATCDIRPTPRMQAISVLETRVVLIDSSSMALFYYNSDIGELSTIVEAAGGQRDGHSLSIDIRWEDHRLRRGSLENQVSCDSPAPFTKRPWITLGIDTLPRSPDFSPALVASSLFKPTDLSSPRPFDVKLQNPYDLGQSVSFLPQHSLLCSSISMSALAL
ncbi:hypothetical protein JOM56_009090 [Amanita muscaria]